MNLTLKIIIAEILTGAIISLLLYCISDKTEGENLSAVPAGSGTAAVSSQTETPDGENAVSDSPEVSAVSGADDPEGGGSSVYETPSSYLIDDFGITLQYPELPTGCEITAATMLVNFYGYDADKLTMAYTYLPTLEYYTYYGDDGLLYGNDMENYFIGDPSGTGYICGVGAIRTALNDYLSDEGSSLLAEDITSAPAEELYALVSQDVPVMVWVTIGMEDRRQTQGWYTETGEYMEWSTNDHGAVLIGYTDETVTIADPISGLVEYEREQFESVYESRGLRSLILEPV